jgi:hypothetical protein
VGHLVAPPPLLIGTFILRSCGQQLVNYKQSLQVKEFLTNTFENKQTKETLGG